MLIIYIRIAGGLGNQLFMFFTGISLAIDYNLIPILDYHSHDFFRHHFTKYTFYNNSNLLKEYCNINSVNNIKEKNFRYELIDINPNINNVLNQEYSGYFQSYKYFWHNIEKIKKYFYIDNEKIIKYKNILNNLEKTIAIHIRLTDYLNNKDYHLNVPIDYYINILSKYNLNEYKIILFSDDVLLAKSMLEKYIDINNIILADTYSNDDEDQLYLLSCTDIRICPNSTYSLWSCYLNEIYKFNENSIYYFPSKWFGPLGPEYDIYDLIPNNVKFNVINL
jgi:hypothetical protein